MAGDSTGKPGRSDFPFELEQRRASDVKKWVIRDLRGGERQRRPTEETADYADYADRESAVPEGNEEKKDRMVRSERVDLRLP